MEPMQMISLSIMGIFFILQKILFCTIKKEMSFKITELKPTKYFYQHRN